MAGRSWFGSMVDRVYAMSSAHRAPPTGGATTRADHGSRSSNTLSGLPWWEFRSNRPRPVPSRCARLRNHRLRVRRCLRIRKPGSAQSSCASGRGACAVGCAPVRGSCAVGPCARAAHSAAAGRVFSCADTQVAVRRRCRRPGTGTSAQRCAQAERAQHARFPHASRTSRPRGLVPDRMLSCWHTGAVVGVLVGSTGTPTTGFVSSL